MNGQETKFLPLAFYAESCHSVSASTAYQLLHHQKTDCKHPFNQSAQKRDLFFRCTHTPTPPHFRTAGLEFIGAAERLSEDKIRGICCQSLITKL